MWNLRDEGLMRMVCNVINNASYATCGTAFLPHSGHISASMFKMYKVPLVVHPEYELVALHPPDVDYDLNDSHSWLQGCAHDTVEFCTLIFSILNNGDTPNCFKNLTL